ncbi:hypothetical protein [Oligoflexus tunisiensis]|uniref:hypothetical protein n=1 Tax=Oligoflexus tunisiensis TaxID=708132 RepID=UPI00114CA345|nr:hypothetical protein [Oligoflexus tunisiensis]
MAPSKRKTAASAPAKAAAKSRSVGSSEAPKDPFKTKKSRVPTRQAENVLTPPEDVAEAVDAFRAAQDQAKFYEGEATVHKNTILNYAAEEYSRRLFTGEGSGFKIQGVETMAMYVVQDASAGISEEDVEEFTERWGKKAAEDLIVRDFGSIRFNEAVLEANYDAVVAALQSLPPEVLDNLFKPMAMKARPGAADLARRHVKNPEELREIIRHLKLRNYVR